MHTLDPSRLAVIGLGYVGLPLEVEFARRWVSAESTACLLRARTLAGHAK
jgi:hypothetical protein